MPTFVSKNHPGLVIKTKRGTRIKFKNGVCNASRPVVVDRLREYAGDHPFKVQETADATPELLGPKNVVGPQTVLGTSPPPAPAPAPQPEPIPVPEPEKPVSPLIEKKKAEKKKRLEDAFAMFALGQGIPLVAEALEVSKGTARNYYAEWKKTWKNSIEN